MKLCHSCNLNQWNSNNYCIRCGINFTTQKKHPIPFDKLEYLRQKNNKSNLDYSFNIDTTQRPRAPYQSDIEAFSKFKTDSIKYYDLQSLYQCAIWIIFIILCGSLYYYNVEVLNHKINLWMFFITIVFMWFAIPKTAKYITLKYLHKKPEYKNYKPSSDYDFYYTLASSKDRYGNQNCIFCGCTKFYKQGEYNSNEKSHSCARCKTYLYTTY